MDPGQPAAGDDPDELRRINVSAQIRFLAPPLKERLRVICARRDVKPTRDGLIAAWGDRAEDLARLVDELEAEDALADQQTLDAAEPVEGEVVQ